MSVENRKLTGRVPGLLILGLLAASAGHSLAADNIPGHDDSGMPVDRHGRSSPAPGGGWVHTLPPGHRLYHHRGRRFYFYDGFWYERGRGGYFVVRPPIGLHVPAPPPIIVAPRPASPVLPPQDSARPPFVYPRNGQSAEVQAADRYECHTWSTGQTGFDPTKIGGAVPAEEHSFRSNQYQRAVNACLAARGYSVR